MLAQNLEDQNPFLSGGPRVRLTRAFQKPFQNVVDTARTCYSSQGIIEDGGERVDLAKSIYKAGHHTTYQHPTFQFAIENVSRHCLWSFLHAHSFYNSEQVSQRYVKVKRDTVAIPRLGGTAQAIYEQAVLKQQETYEALSQQLYEVSEKEYFKLFPPRAKDPQAWRMTIRRKCYEAARYVLPVATTAYLYHTVSGLTLLRYFRMCQTEDTPTESRLLATAMVNELLALDPTFAAILEQPLERDDFPETQALTRLDSDADSWCEEFDRQMDGKFSIHIGGGQNNEGMVAEAVRAVLGVSREVLGDEAAVRLALDPSQNTILGQTLNLSTHHKLSRCLHHAHFVFKKRISHTGDSQNQRHRMTPASRPILARHLRNQPDYITPRIFHEDSVALKMYQESMEQSWEAMGKLRQLGVGEEWLQYLLPNAVTLRFVESSDLLNLRHKHVMRLCYNAQEEIWQASLEEAQQIRQHNPIIGGYLLPPCGVRDQSKQRPVCPEGDRYCGVRVWKLDLNDYKRVL